MTMTTAQRNAAIVKDFAKGGVSKAALARKYGVDEATIRRALKASGQASATQTKASSPKQTPKTALQQKAQKLTGAKKSAKADTKSSAQDQSIVVGSKVTGKYSDGTTGVVKAIEKGFRGEPDRYHVLWAGRQSTFALHLDDIQLVGAVKTEVKPTVTGIRAALEAGKAVQYIITGDSIVLTLGDDSEIVDSTHANFKAIRAEILDGNFAEAYKLMNIAKSITEFTKGAITVRGDNLYYGELEMRSSLVTRILELMKAGDDAFKSLVAFFERLLNNPSKESVDQLWGFVSHLDVEIDEDGYIIGWKKVRAVDGRLFDSYTGKVPNDVGNVVEMPRFMVNADRHTTCSQGLHVGAWGYASKFSGDTLLKVKVDPADVVSVPNDYNDMKMRAAKYEVVSVADYQGRAATNFKRAADVKKLHVKIGTGGQILDSKEI